MSDVILDYILFKVYMTRKLLFCLKKEHKKLGGLPLTVFKYLIQSYDHLKKFYTRQVVTSSLGMKMGYSSEPIKLL